VNCRLVIVKAVFETQIFMHITLITAWMGADSAAALKDAV